MTRIKTASISDIPDILLLEKTCFSPAWSEDHLLSELNCEDACFLIAASESGLSGFCIMHRAGDEAELYQIAVEPVGRRCGIGAALLSHGIGWAKTSGLRRIFLEVRAGNTPALSLYEKYGFRALGIRRNYYDRPMEDAVIMSLDEVHTNDNTIC